MVTLNSNSVNASNGIIAKYFASIKYYFAFALALVVMSCSESSSPTPASNTNVSFTGGPFSSKTTLSFNDAQASLEYSTKYGYSIYMTNSNYIMPDNQKRKISILCGIGFNPKAISYTWGQTYITGLIIADPNGYEDDEVWVGNESGLTYVTSYNQNGTTEGTIKGTFYNGDTGEAMEVDGKFTINNSNPSVKKTTGIFQSGSISQVNADFQKIQSKSK
jgi:hypothetical protein